MRRMMSCLVIMILALHASAQTVVRKADESAKDFAIRCAPPGMSIDNELQQQIIETTEWTKKDAVIAFYSVQVTDPHDHQVYFNTVGYIYIPLTANNYQRVLIDTFETEGGDPHITSVFFANADKDSKRELVVLCKWPQQHYQISGDILETRIYDNIDAKRLPEKLTFLKTVSDKVDGGFDGDREGETVKSKFKTAKQVREGLLALGFN